MLLLDRGRSKEEGRKSSDVTSISLALLPEQTSVISDTYNVAELLTSSTPIILWYLFMVAKVFPNSTTICGGGHKEIMLCCRWTSNCQMTGTTDTSVALVRDTRTEVSFRENPIICKTLSTKHTNELGRDRQKVHMMWFTSNVKMCQLGTNSKLSLQWNFDCSLLKSCFSCVHTQGRTIFDLGLNFYGVGLNGLNFCDLGVGSLGLIFLHLKFLSLDFLNEQIHWFITLTCPLLFFIGHASAFCEEGDKETSSDSETEVLFKDAECPLCCSHLALIVPHLGATVLPNNVPCWCFFVPVEVASPLHILTNQAFVCMWTCLLSPHDMSLENVMGEMRGKCKLKREFQKGACEHLELCKTHAMNISAGRPWLKRSWHEPWSFQFTAQEVWLFGRNIHPRQWKNKLAFEVISLTCQCNLNHGTLFFDVWVTGLSFFQVWSTTTVRQSHLDEWNKNWSNCSVQIFGIIGLNFTNWSWWSWS